MCVMYDFVEEKNNLLQRGVIKNVIRENGGKEENVVEECVAEENEGEKVVMLMSEIKQEEKDMMNEATKDGVMMNDIIMNDAMMSKTMRTMKNNIIEEDKEEAIKILQQKLEEYMTNYPNEDRIVLYFQTNYGVTFSHVVSAEDFEITDEELGIEKEDLTFKVQREVLNFVVETNPETENIGFAMENEDMSFFIDFI